MGISRFGTRRPLRDGLRARNDPTSGECRIPPVKFPLNDPFDAHPRGQGDEDNRSTHCHHGGAVRTISSVDAQHRTVLRNNPYFAIIRYRPQSCTGARMRPYARLMCENCQNMRNSTRVRRCKAQIFLAVRSSVTKVCADVKRRVAAGIQLAALTEYILMPVVPN